MSMDRFKNSYENEYAWCVGCDRKFYYTHLNDRGFCPDCAQAERKEQQEREYENAPRNPTPRSVNP